MGLGYGIGGLIEVPPAALEGPGAPPASFKGKLGQQYFDRSTSPPTEYIYNGQTWNAGGNVQATETVAGIAEISTAAEALAGTDDTTIMTPAKVALIAIAGAPLASTTQAGIIEIATDAEAAAQVATGLAIVPSNLPSVMAAPGAIGGTTPAAGTFTAVVGTTAHFTGLITGDASATITTGATALNLASDASTGAVNIGTGAGARTITIGNITGATAVVVNTGTGNFAVTTTGTGDITLDSDDTMLLDADGVLELNSSAGAISIGNDADANAINIGTGAAARTITVGNSTGATAIVLNGGS